MSGSRGLGTAATCEGVRAHVQRRQPGQKGQKFQRSWVSPECGMERGDGIQSNCTLIKGRERLLQILCVCARACVWRCVDV